MFVNQDMMDGLNEAGVCVIDPFMNVDWMYEFSAPKYHDFSCEETQADVLVAERWFEIAIPYENSRTCSRSTSTYPVVRIVDTFDEFCNLNFDNELNAEHALEQTGLVNKTTVPLRDI